MATLSNLNAYCSQWLLIMTRISGKWLFFRIIKWLKSATNGQKDTTVYKILQCTVLWWYNFLVNREYQWRWIGLFWIHHLVHFEPPVLSNLSEEDLRQVVAEGRVPDAIYGLPSQNQSMERAIKLVSQTSEKVIKEEDGEWIIHIVIALNEPSYILPATTGSFVDRNFLIFKPKESFR